MAKQKSKNLKVLFAAREAAPFVKEGGLGDVVGSLPKALVGQGIDVRLILPLYRAIDRKKYKLKKRLSGVRVWGGFAVRRTNLWEGVIPGTRIPVYFVDFPPYFDRAKLEGYRDDKKRFAFFSTAILTLLKTLDFRPDVIHAHDWQVGFLPLQLQQLAKEDPFFRDVATVFTIHNIGYQGASNPKILKYDGLTAADAAKIIAQDLRDGDIDQLFEGIGNATMVSTVSSVYATEILGSQGYGMQGILRQRRARLVGIVNGIDTAAWNPATDREVPVRYSRLQLGKRAANKAALQKKFGLPRKPQVPVFAVVSRLAQQKGVGLLLDVIEKLLATTTCQLVIVGNGEPLLERKVAQLARRFPQNVRAVLQFDAVAAKLAYAGSDFFLMPSLYEPCGLGQMIAMRYGSIPVVRATGGLAETVRDVTAVPTTGTGFVFKKFAVRDFSQALRRALAFYADAKKTQALRRRIMARDFSWTRAAKQYRALYAKAMRLHRADFNSSKS